MAGGIFVERPFHLNPKCVIFAFILMAGYWFMPPKQVILLPMIFITSYIALAWYDFVYNCDVPLFSGISPIGAATFDSWGKPQRRQNRPAIPTDVPLVKDQERAYRRNVNLFHVLGVMPFFLLMAYLGLNNTINKGERAALWMVFGWIILYHGTRFFILPREVLEIPEIQAKETADLRAVNLLHLLGVAPIVAYTLTYGGDLSWTLLGTAGTMAGIYHGFRLIYPRLTKQ